MTNSVIIPKGTYFLGDPCYAIDNADWHDFLDRTDFMDSVDDQNGKIAFGFSTAYGDGTYKASNGYKFGVDSGTIGLVHIDRASDTTGGQVITFDRDTLCTNDNGKMTFGNIRINTRK